ncbi:MAG: hypothetical protein B6U86_04020 [Candidatus Altiarchaeales archaeon ex4484_43]|nr:MAG: hypothetical protein B6U86_04020 [Candidatus Altiarchaeales archaeon ex4484_43]RLI88545.1 MAG: hypothetical protein DRO62_03585 [Candidatus Altiarchaeales archaeon]
MKLVIGLAGRMGSGKTVVCNYLHERYGAKQMRFSQILMDILDRLYLPHEREYLQKLGHSLRTSLGEDVIVNAFEEDMKRGPSKIIAIDGIRYMNEVKMLRKFEENLLIFVDAPVDIRFRRCRARGEKGEGKTKFEEFLRAEERETERYIDEIGKIADYRIENTKSLKELYEEVDGIFGSRL